MVISKLFYLYGIFKYGILIFIRKFLLVQAQVVVFLENNRIIGKGLSQRFAEARRSMLVQC